MLPLQNLVHMAAKHLCHHHWGGRHTRLDGSLSTKYLTVTCVRSPTDSGHPSGNAFPGRNTVVFSLGLPPPAGLPGKGRSSSSWCRGRRAAPALQLPPTLHHPGLTPKARRNSSACLDSASLLPLPAMAALTMTASWQPHARSLVSAASMAPASLGVPWPPAVSLQSLSQSSRGSLSLRLLTERQPWVRGLS